VWTSLRDVVTRAGPLDALMPHLKNARIMARAAGFYDSEGRPWKGAPADGLIPANWWLQLCSVDPAANRATFRVVVFSMVGPGLYDKVESFTDDIQAIGVELESAAAEALFPKATVPASQHVDGKDAEQDREGAAFGSEGAAASPNNREENEIAIELAAQALREDKTLTKKKLFERVMNSRKWSTQWTFNRFVEKVWRPARERAELSPASGGRPKK
jgi:hypothetical protein